MHQGQLVFAQLMLYLLLSTFRRCVADHSGERHNANATRPWQIYADFALKPELIGDLYRQRWRVELFFKWIKQHLHIKVFFGTSENAVKTQIWIAMSTYLLIAFAKKRLHLDDHSLNEILQILSLSMFETMQINQLHTPPSIYSESDFESNQLALL